MWRKHLKRGTDFLLSLTGLMVLSPLLLLIAILIKLESKGPVIFRQKRLGLHGVPFEIYKFRSMCVGAEKQGSGVYSFKGDSRITRVGRIIRATSIDELPQELPFFVEQFKEEIPRYMVKHQVRPGITGWAQVNGRKEVPWPERIELNIEYVDRLSFAFDAKIFFMTIFKVFTMADNNNVSQTNK